jgi:hypothetical protein
MYVDVVDEGQGPRASGEAESGLRRKIWKALGKASRLKQYIQRATDPCLPFSGISALPVSSFLLPIMVGLIRHDDDAPKAILVSLDP